MLQSISFIKNGVNFLIDDVDIHLSRRTWNEFAEVGSRKGACS